MAAALLLSLTLCSCLTERIDVQVIQYPGEGGRRDRVEPGECDVDILGAGHFELAHCRDIGDVFVGDTGSSTNCGQARARREILGVACQADANAVVIRRIRDAHSDCFQARARLLRCTPPSAEEVP